MTCLNSLTYSTHGTNLLKTELSSCIESATTILCPLAFLSGFSQCMDWPYKHCHISHTQQSYGIRSHE
jgi:hypothetical protein